MFCCCIPDLLVVLPSLCLTVCWSPLGEPSIKSPLNSWYVHQDQWYLVPIISKIMTTPRRPTMNMIIPELTIIKKERHSQHITARTECQHCPDLFDGEKTWPNAPEAPGIEHLQEPPLFHGVKIPWVQLWILWFSPCKYSDGKSIENHCFPIKHHHEIP